MNTKQGLKKKSHLEAWVKVDSSAGKVTLKAHLSKWQGCKLETLRAACPKDKLDFSCSFWSLAKSCLMVFDHVQYFKGRAVSQISS